MRDEACRRLDNSRRADRSKQCARVERACDLVEAIGHFSEPANVRPDSSTAIAARNFGRRLVRACVVKRRTTAAFAAALEELAMHVNDAARTRLFVQAVDVLGAKEQAVSQRLLEFREGDVPRIRFRICSHAAPHRIEFPHERWIALPRSWRRNFLETIIAPDSAGAAKSRDSAFSADTRAGENEDAISRGDFDHGFSVTR